MNIKEQIQELLQIKKPRYITVSFLQKNYISLYKEIINITSFLEENSSISERLYCIIHDINEYPKCPYCGKLCKYWHNFNMSPSKYNCFCSVSCSRLYYYSLEEKETHACLKCGKIIPKRSNGKDVFFCSSKCSANSPQTNKKRKETNLQKYGTLNVFQNQNIKEKIKQTNRQKYGEDSITKTDIYKRNIYDKAYENLQRFNEFVIPLFPKEEYIGSNFNTEYNWLCKKCNNQFHKTYVNGLMPLCPKCHHTSNIEKQIIQFLLKHNISFDQNKRSIIPPYELDIYIPQHNLAIEIDGLYWHSEDFLNDKEYHLRKTNLCKNKNINLIHIFEDEIKLKFPIVISNLKHLLGLCKYQINQSKYFIKEISPQLKDKFLQKYHLEPNDNSDIYLGAYYKNYLISLICLTQNYSSIKIHKIVYLYNFNVINIESKFIEYILDIYKPKEISFEINNRWNIYNFEKIGFILKNTTDIDYSYFQNSDTSKRYFKHEISDVNNYNKIWDCGKIIMFKNYSLNY